LLSITFINAAAMLKLTLTLLLISISYILNAQRTLVTYNVRNAKGMDNKTDYDRIASVIKNTKADIVGLQELDSITKRSDSTYVLEVIAKKAGYNYVYASAISYQGGRYGVGILSKQKPKTYYSVPLPGKEEERVLLIAEFKDFIVFCTHWSLTDADRMRSVDIINAEAKKFKKPVYLLGDLNAEPNSNAISALKTQWNLLTGEEATFPATTPTKCIDYIFTRNNSGIKIKNRSVINEPMASDHRPVMVKLRR
jgi:endonuclease/exonuclease/phosphatase family metal-dependent hydrolase